MVTPLTFFAELFLSTFTQPGRIYGMTRRRAEIDNGHPTYIFCGIIPFCNFPYRNRVHSITLIPFKIIS